MKLINLEIHNFLRLGNLSVDLSGSSVHIFAGPNEAGKSSLYESIRFALLGETPRIEKKGDYHRMVRDGTKGGSVGLSWEIVGDGGVEHDNLTRDIESGKAMDREVEPEFDSLLPYVMDATRFAWSDAKIQRDVLFKLLDVHIDVKTVVKRLQSKPYDLKKNMTDAVGSLLLSGFDAAHKEATRKATECRGVWKGITGETYGTKKADGWAAQKRDVDVDEFDAMEKRLAACRLQLKAKTEEYGAMKAHPHAQGLVQPCPGCGVKLTGTVGAGLKLYDEETPATPSDVLRGTKRQIDGIQSVIDELEPKVRSIEDDAKWNLQLSDIEKKADQAHFEVLNWITVASALAPDGIPAEMIADKILPINERLKYTSQITGWPLVTIQSDMHIMVDGRIFQLQSESSQWRAQAAIAEAISNLSGVGLLVLDRIDVLDLRNRSLLVKWLNTICNDHETIIAFGTLKQLPKLPPSMQAHWIEAGAIGIDKDAA